MVAGGCLWLLVVAGGCLWLLVVAGGCLWLVACGLLLVACCLWFVACGLWLVACGLLLVACGLWLVCRAPKEEKTSPPFGDFATKLLVKKVAKLHLNSSFGDSNLNKTLLFTMCCACCNTKRLIFTVWSICSPKHTLQPMFTKQCFSNSFEHGVAVQAPKNSARLDLRCFVHAAAD